MGGMYQGLKPQFYPVGLIWNLVLVPLQHIVSSRTEVQEGLLDHPHHEPEAKVLFP